MDLDKKYAFHCESGGQKLTTYVVRWHHALFLTIDANFHLKYKKVSKNSINPSLSNGWAYFIEEANYKAYLEDQANFSQEVHW